MVSYYVDYGSCDAMDGDRMAIGWHSPLCSSMAISFFKVCLLGFRINFAEKPIFRVIAGQMELTYLVTCLRVSSSVPSRRSWKYSRQVPYSTHPHASSYVALIH
jgi:hypothetical protein